MSYSIEFSTKAEKQFRKLTPQIQKKLSKKIDQLSQTPRPNGVTKLSGEDSIYRIRESDYRIIYMIIDHKLMILVVKIGHRRDVYQ